MTQFIGIVWHEAAKFTPLGEQRARAAIRELLRDPGVTVVSGGCHLGGIDIWAEEEARALGFPEERIIVYAPKRFPGGFMERNLKIAAKSNVVYSIVVTSLPETYTGLRFPYCYHCKTYTHIKSGGCWTAKRAREGRWIEIANV